MLRLARLTLVVLALTFAVPLIAAAANVLQTQSTNTYNVTLAIGPAEPMVMPDAVNGAISGEVMAAMPGMPVSEMASMDAGHRVNHHLEVHLVNKNNGTVVTDASPTILLTDGKTGASRAVSPVSAMYGVSAGPSDWHYGGNVYLADGTYTVTITISGETATFKDLAVTGGVTAEAPKAEGALPKTGGLPTAGIPFVALSMIGAGVLLRGPIGRANQSKAG